MPAQWIRLPFSWEHYKRLPFEALQDHASEIQRTLCHADPQTRYNIDIKLRSDAELLFGSLNCLILFQEFAPDILVRTKTTMPHLARLVVDAEHTTAHLHIGKVAPKSYRGLQPNLSCHLVSHLAPLGEHYPEHRSANAGILY